MVATAVLAGVAAVDRHAIAQDAEQIHFDVPAGPLARALAAFGRQAGIQVTYLTAVSAGKTSPGVSGAATPEDALARILYGTGLAYSFPNVTTAAVSEPETRADGSRFIDVVAVIHAALAAQAAGARAPISPASHVMTSARKSEAALWRDYR